MFKSKLRIFLKTLLVLVLMSVVYWHSLLGYGLSQAKGQLSIIWNARPISEALADDTFPDSLKYKLRLVEEIKTFAVDSIGITPSENYTSVYHQSDKPIMLVVSACEAYSLTAKTWNFPFLGDVPYKGFFDPEKAKIEINILKKQNYDVSTYTPSGWSTLGWLNDPVLSKMLLKSEGGLSDLIIHELTHGTLFVKDDVDFNENLASFIGNKGAQQFLIYKFGSNSTELLDFLASKKDREIFTEYMLKSTEILDSLYNSFQNESVEIKEKKKMELIQEIIANVSRLPLTKKEGYSKFAKTALKDKNTFFMSFNRYDSQYELFDNELKNSFKGNLKDYLNWLKEKYPSL